MISELVKRWLLPPGVSDLIGEAMYGRGKPAEKKLSPEDLALLAENEALRDRHRGSRCFVLGAGSSIKEQDLKKLKGEYVISVSNTFVHPDYPVFRPRYHVLPYLLQGHGQLHTPEKFAVWLKEMEEKTFDAEMFMHIGDRGLVTENGLFRGRKMHWVEYARTMETKPGEPVDLSRLPLIWSVSETAISVALYLGFDKIYLIGIDHDWFNGLYVYFYDKNTEHKMQADAKNLEHVDSEFQMRRHAEIFKKYKYLYSLKRNIYNANANPNHYLDVFPKVDFDTLFENDSTRKGR